MAFYVSVQLPSLLIVNADAFGQTWSTASLKAIDLTVLGLLILLLCLCWLNATLVIAAAVVIVIIGLSRLFRNCTFSLGVYILCARPFRHPTFAWIDGQD